MRLLPPALEARGDRLLHLASVGSTMDEARHLHEREPGRVWIVADAQEAGRGRSGRVWLSPPGNLHLTLLSPTPNLAPRDQPKLASRPAWRSPNGGAALLPEEAEVRLKWPNDLLVDGAKASGILLEGLGGAPRSPSDSASISPRIPDDTPYPATHLAAHAPTLDRAGFFPVLAERLTETIARLESDGFAPLRRRWLDRAAHLGRASPSAATNGSSRGFSAISTTMAACCSRPMGTRSH